MTAAGPASRPDLPATPPPLCFDQAAACAPALTSDEATPAEPVRCARRGAELIVRTLEGCFHQAGRSAAVHCHPRAADEPVLQALFERTVWPLMLQAHGLQVLHASVVGDAERALALAGPSHAGKSTLAMACKRAGLPLWADDGVGLAWDGARLCAHPLPSPLRLRPDAAAHFECAETACEPARTLTLAAIVLLDPADAPRTELRRATAAEAYRGLLAQAYCFDPPETASRHALADFYLDLAARHPVHVLSGPRDLAALPERVAALAGAG